MALIQTRRLSQLGEGLRLDPDYHQLDSSASSAAEPMGALLADIRYGLQAEPSYIQGGVRYVRALNLASPWIDGEILQIDRSQVPHDDYLLRPGDILITRSGANCGDVGMVTEAYAGATFGSYTIRLRCSPRINPFVLFAYLLGAPGQAQTRRCRSGSAQPNLSIPNLQSLVRLPTLPESLQDRVEPLVRSAIRKAHARLDLLREAEGTLLERLGWRADWLEPAGTFQVRLGQFKAAQRMDAEHFHPGVRQLRRQLASRGARAIGSFAAPLTRGVLPQYDPEGTVVVVNSKHVGKFEIEDRDPERTISTFYDAPTCARARLQPNDVLQYATGAHVGRAAVWLSDCPALASNHVLIIRPEPRFCDPFYLALFLNSPAGRCQSENFATGSAQRELYPSEAASVLVYLPATRRGSIDIGWQRRLGKAVGTALAARTETQRDLKTAVQIVADASR